jgi:hypothetical protein
MNARPIRRRYRFRRLVISTFFNMNLTLFLHHFKGHDVHHAKVTMNDEQRFILLDTDASL